MQGAAVMKMKLEFNEGDNQEISDEQAQPYYDKLCEAIHKLTGFSCSVDYLPDKKVHFIRCPEIFKHL